MKCLFAITTIFFGLWFWRQPQMRQRNTWPREIPVFSGSVPECSYELKSGSSFVHVVMPGAVEDALSAVRSSFAAEGWQESPVRACDLLIFTRGDAVAAVHVGESPSGTRVTAIGRKHGL